MDSITISLVAGASFLAKGIASEAIKDTYGELKNLLSGRLLSLATLEEDPSDQDYRKATEKEVQKKGLASDSILLGKASELAQAVDLESEAQLVTMAINIDQLRAAKDVIVGGLHATGGVRVRDVRSIEGKIDIQDVSAGTQRKN